jgi:hypothetical protein
MNQDPPGRFVENHTGTGRWYNIGYKKAVEKTSQALREGAPKLRSKLNSILGGGTNNVEQNFANSADTCTSITANYRSSTSYHHAPLSEMDLTVMARYLLPASNPLCQTQQLNGVQGSIQFADFCKVSPNFAGQVAQPIGFKSEGLHSFSDILLHTDCYSVAQPPLGYASSQPSTGVGHIDYTAADGDHCFMDTRRYSYKKKQHPDPNYSSSRRLFVNKKLGSKNVHSNETEILQRCAARRPSILDESNYNEKDIPVFSLTRSIPGPAGEDEAKAKQENRLKNEFPRQALLFLRDVDKSIPPFSSGCSNQFPSKRLNQQELIHKKDDKFTDEPSVAVLAGAIIGYAKRGRVEPWSNYEIGSKEGGGDTGHSRFDTKNYLQEMEARKKSEEKGDKGSKGKTHNPLKNSSLVRFSSFERNEGNSKTDCSIRSYACNGKNTGIDHQLLQLSQEYLGRKISVSKRKWNATDISQSNFDSATGKEKQITITECKEEMAIMHHAHSDPQIFAVRNISTAEEKKDKEASGQDNEGAASLSNRVDMLIQLLEEDM